MSRAETDAAILQARELFAGLGDLSIRKMFGGAGIYAGPTFFACIFEGEIYLRADEVFAQELSAEGSIPFVWLDPRSGKEIRMKYWRIPDSALDDPEQARQLARRGLSLSQGSGRSRRLKRAPKS